MAQANLGTYEHGRWATPDDQPIPLVHVRRGAFEPRDEHGDWGQYGRASRISTDDAYWDEMLEDRAAAIAWERGKLRRTAVKALGWMAILAAIAGVCWVGTQGKARDAVLAWGTLGQGQAAARAITTE